MQPAPPGWPRISSALFYDDPRAAIDWLCRAFGFEVRLLVEGEGGRVDHSELTYPNASTAGALEPIGLVVRFRAS